MADDPQTPEAEHTEPNPAVANQPPANVAVVYDREGREHFASPTSKFVVDGLADGTLTEEPPAKTEEAPDGAETGSSGDDPKSGDTDGGEGSGDGSPEAGGSGRRRRAGTA